MFPGVSKYNSVLKTLRNSPFPRRQTPAKAILLTSRDVEFGADVSAATGTKVGRESLQGSGRENAFLDAGGKFGGAEGWLRGYVAAFLSDMRTVGLKPDNETYRCAIRCATDAAVFDESRVMTNAAVTEDDEMLEMKAVTSEDLEVPSTGTSGAEGKSLEAFR